VLQGYVQQEKLVIYKENPVNLSYSLTVRSYTVGLIYDNVSYSLLFSFCHQLSHIQLLKMIYVVVSEIIYLWVSYHARR
jgi:hypothetical protein